MTDPLADLARADQAASHELSLLEEERRRHAIGPSGLSEAGRTERVLRARAAAHALHAKYDSRELTAPARAAALSRFERQVDPDGTLPVAERQRRAEHAKKAYFTGLALKSAVARRKRR